MLVVGLAKAIIVQNFMNLMVFKKRLGLFFRSNLYEWEGNRISFREGVLV